MSRECFAIAAGAPCQLPSADALPRDDKRTWLWSVTSPWTTAQRPRDRERSGGGCPPRLGRPRGTHRHDGLARPPTRPTAPPPAFWPSAFRSGSRQCVVSIGPARSRLVDRCPTWGDRGRRDDGGPTWGDRGRPMTIDAIGGSGAALRASAVRANNHVADRSRLSRQPRELPGS